MVYYYIAMTIKRFFYYTPFCISNGAIIASGLGYNGIDKSGSHKWDKIVAIYIMGVETSNSCMEMLKSWNHQVHLWLKFYVMARLVEPGKRPGMLASMSTFIVSAFWHGFYPSFYSMFFFAAVLSECTKDIYKSWVFFQWIPALPKHILGHIVSMIFMNYLGIMFAALTAAKQYQFLKATYFSIPITLAVFILISRSINLVGIANAKVRAADKTKKE